MAASPNGIFLPTDRRNKKFNGQEEDRVHSSSRANLLCLLAMAILASACATMPSDQGSIIQIVHDLEGVEPFKNVLIISVAGDFPTRAKFEQNIVNALSSDEALVTAFYAVVGRNPQLTRNILNNAVRSRLIDAIILTRIQGQDRADLYANRPTGREFDLYLYDYPELNTPVRIKTDTTNTFIVEVYDTRAEKKVWAIESLVFNSRTVDEAVSKQSAAIAAEILRDGLVQR